MRAALAALLLLASPALAGECAYYNQSDQSVSWDGDKHITYDPLFADRVGCDLVPIPDTNGYNAKCGNWSDTFIVGLSKPDAPYVDIVVFQNTFFWYRCAKDRA